jgi:hypothetical protein
MTKPITRDPLHRRRGFDADIIELAHRIPKRQVQLWARSALPIGQRSMGRVALTGDEMINLIHRRRRFSEDAPEPL